MTKISVQAIIKADAQKTWDYYTMPKHITNWNFASDDWQCPSASNDLQVGGKYAARMEAKDGSFGFDFEAIYQNIELGESFTYLMPDGREVNCVFKKLGDETELITTFDAETINPLELQQQGWQAILNNFKKYVEQD